MQKFVMAAIGGTLAGVLLSTQVAGPLLAQETDRRTSVYEQLDLFGDIFERIRAQYVEEVDEEDLIEAAINGMLTSLDPHSSYLSPKDAADMRVQTRGSFGGLGIEVTLDSGFVKVVSPIDDTPAAKAGIIAFTKSLAREVGSRGITANVVAPGFIDTDMTRSLEESQRESLLSSVPLNRLGKVSDIADAVVFLASDSAAYITGETLHVNGGMYMA